MVNRLLVDEEFAEEVQLRATEREAVRNLKEKLHKDGYRYGISFYGRVINKETLQEEYRRVEILARTPLDNEWLEKYVYHLREAPLPYQYSLWVLTHRKRIRLIWKK